MVCCDFLRCKTYIGDVSKLNSKFCKIMKLLSLYIVNGRILLKQDFGQDVLHVGTTL